MHTYHITHPLIQNRKNDNTIIPWLLSATGDNADALAESKPGTITNIQDTRQVSPASWDGLSCLSPFQ